MRTHPTTPSTRTRPITTLSMLTSLDGKITSGITDAPTLDQAWPLIPGVKSPLPTPAENLNPTPQPLPPQNSALSAPTQPSNLALNTPIQNPTPEPTPATKSTSQTTQPDTPATQLPTLTSGPALVALGANTAQTPPLPATLIVIDHRPDLNRRAVEHLAKSTTRLVLVTTNATHPAYRLLKDHPNIDILYYITFNPRTLLSDLATKYSLTDLLLRPDGALAGLFLRADLIDFVDLTVAPLLVGGQPTPTLIDGDPLTTQSDLSLLRPLQLLSATPLPDSFLRLRYQVVHSD